MQHIWPIFNKNTHTCDKNGIDINERENFQDIFIHTFSFFTRKISQEKSGTAKPKWNNLLDSHLRRKLKRSEGETKSSDLNKTEDSGIKNEPDLNHQGKMADNHELQVDDGDEEMLEMMIV